MCLYDFLNCLFTYFYNTSLNDMGKKNLIQDRRKNQSIYKFLLENIVATDKC